MNNYSDLNCNILENRYKDEAEINGSLSSSKFALDQLEMMLNIKPVRQIVSQLCRKQHVGLIHYYLVKLFPVRVSCYSSSYEVRYSK